MLGFIGLNRRLASGRSSSCAGEVRRVSIKEAVQLFLRIGALNGWKASTAGVYGDMMRVFLRWLGCDRDVDITSLSLERVYEYLDWLRTEGRSAKTVWNHYLCLHSMFEQLRKLGKVAASPCADMKVRRPLSAERAWLANPADLELCLDTVRDSWLYGPVVTALCAGLRAAEVRALEWNDVQSEVLVVGNKIAAGHTTKSRHVRVVPICADLHSALVTEWCEQSCPRSGWIWRGARGGRLARQWNRVFNERMDEVGLGQITVHCLRHTWASRLLNAGVPSFHVQRWGGWSEAEMLSRYGHLLGGYHAGIEHALPATA